MWTRLATLACLAAGLLAAPERPQGATLSCPRTQGLFSHPTDCHKFLHCDHGHPYVKDCPADLHFNVELMVCDWPENAGCTGGTPIDPPTPEEDPDPSMECDCECCLKPSGDDCTSYYICKDGKAYKKTCAPGLVFNPNIDNCDRASNYHCEITTTTPKTTTTTTPRPVKTTTPPPKPADFDCPADINQQLFPNPKDCHTFFHCSNGQAYLKECPADLEFNPTLLVCDWPQNAGCSIKPTTTSPKPTTTPKPADFDCPADINQQLFPNPKDCHTFFHCSNGQAYLKECPANLEFNPTLLVCDWPQNAGCSIKSTTPKATTTKATTPRPTTPSGFQCPKDGLYPNPKDCHTFYHCSNGIAYLKDCPADLEFNPTLLVCDWPQNAGCSIKPTTTSPKPTTTQKPADFDCPDDINQQLFPNPKDCHTFFHCSNGQAYLKECPADLEFNPTLLVCDWPQNAGCSIKPTTPKATTTKATTPKPTTPAGFQCPKDGLYPNPEDCHTFYHCSNGHAYLKDCPANLEFNPVLLVCDWPENAGCNGKPTPAPPKPTPKPTPNPDVICPNETCVCRVPDPSDCNKFYQCSEGKAYPASCPDGLVYNPASEVCDLPANVPGCQPTTPKPTTTTKATTPSGFQCPKDGLYPNPEDCHTFYHCSNGHAYLKDCPANLEFNPVLLVCDWPQNAGCNGKPTPAPKPTSIPTPKPTPNPDVTCPNETCACRLPDPVSCACFYECHDGAAFRECCPAGLHFNKDTEVCDLPENVDCEPEPTPAPAPCTFPCTKVDGRYGNPLNCGSYFECAGGQASIHYCPSDKHFSADSGACDAAVGDGC